MRYASAPGWTRLGTAISLVFVLASAGTTHAQGRGGAAEAMPPAPTDLKPGSITYEEVAYPHPVKFLPLRLYGHDVRLAYMDVPPAGQPNGRTVMLFHGMNFGGFYFGTIIDALRRDGYRVVVPDQIGFGRSSKPIIPYNFNDMALNSRKLLESLGISRVSVIGHSMGGMLTARFAATHPDIVDRIVIYNPIGLTDVRHGAGRWRSADEVYKTTMSQSADELYRGFYANIKRYFPPANWKPEFENYARILYAPTLSSEWPHLAMVRAIFTQMPFLDPVVYDWAHIKARALVFGGDQDGPDFPARARHIADTIPAGELLLIPGLGHVPHFEDPERVNRELLKFLASDAPARQ